MNDSHNISIKAIVVGFLVDIGGTFLANIAYGLIMGIILAAQGLTPAEIETTMAEGPAVYLTNLIIGFIFTFVGGYVAGRIAKTAEVFHGGMVGILGILLGLVLYKPLNMGAYPQWYIVLGFATAIPIALLGGYAAKSKGEGEKPKPYLYL